MARLNAKGKRRKKLLLADISGHIGKTFVVKQYKNTIVISNFPDMDGVKPSAEQKGYRRLFKQAVAYAKLILKDPKKKAALKKKLKGRRTVFQAAISQYMRSAGE